MEKRSVGLHRDCQNLCGVPNYLRNADKGAWAYPGTAQFLRTPISSGTLKAMNFKFGRNIRRLNLSKRPLKILETRGHGRSQGLSKIFRAAMYRAHRAVVFAIAQLSCCNKAPAPVSVPVFFISFRLRCCFLYNYKTRLTFSDVSKFRIPWFR